MKKKRLHTDPEEVRRELQKVADELGLPLNDYRVCYEWSERGNNWNKRVSDELMAKLYFPIVTPSNSPLTIEIMEQRLLLIADELGIDVMEWRVIEECLKRYENKFPRVITREVLSLYFNYNDDDCIPINPKRKRVGDGFLFLLKEKSAILNFIFYALYFKQQFFIFNNRYFRQRQNDINTITLNRINYCTCFIHSLILFLHTCHLT